MLHQYKVLITNTLVLYEPPNFIKVGLSTLLVCFYKS